MAVFPTSPFHPYNLNCPWCRGKVVIHDISFSADGQAEVVAICEDCGKITCRLDLTEVIAHFQLIDFASELAGTRPVAC